MRAAYYERFGGPGVLRFGELTSPEPAPGEVRIRVRAAGVNPIDWKLMSGEFEGLFPHEFPVVPGWDAAGTLDAHGAGVEAPPIGTRVFAYCRKPVVHGGTYAGHVTVPADYVAEMPQRMGFAEAAALPLAALTAWQSLFQHGDLRSGQRILIHAGAGGVGSLAVQMAAWKGADIVSTASSRNRDYVLGLGAETVIDYRSAEAWDALAAASAGGFDLVFDTVGGETLARSYPLVRRGGTLPALNDAPDEELCKARSVKGVRVFSEPSGTQLAEIAAMFEAGKLRLPQIETLPLADAAEALRRSMAGHVRGKLALEID